MGTGLEMAVLGGDGNSLRIWRVLTIHELYTLNVIYVNTLLGAVRRQGCLLDSFPGKPDTHPLSWESWNVYKDLDLSGGEWSQGWGPDHPR